MTGAQTEASIATTRFRAARDFLLEHRADPETADRSFRWPELQTFNWAIDWFDVVARDNRRPALVIVEEDGTETVTSYAEMSERSSRIAGWLAARGVGRGDRVLLMLGNQTALWECLLALIKLGSVLVPATTLLTAADIRDRIERGRISHVIAEAGVADRFQEIPNQVTRISVGPHVQGWQAYEEWIACDDHFVASDPTPASDPLLLYFTSGTTAQPKLVEHTHVSYPVGHLSTMYWIGVQPGDVHLNISSAGWAKHAWSSVFAPWNAEATVLVLNSARFSARVLLDTLARRRVATFCAPPTVWRMLVQEDLGARPVSLREAVSAGEPLNPEVIERVRNSWQLTIRDGYGQTETTAQVGNPPGQAVKLGSMGRALPGYAIELVDPVTDAVGDQGEICIDLSRRPLGLMSGYRDDAERSAEAMRGGFYHTGDMASRDGDGYITYVGRADDVFKASDYRLSPFELESALIECAAVAEAAVVPSPDPIRGAVPKAFVALAAGFEPSAATAQEILRDARERLAPYKRIRRLEFAELPKTISGKIRRVELRQREEERRARGPEARAEMEYWEEDFSLPH